jgi:hypothetical protein
LILGSYEVYVGPWRPETSAAHANLSREYYLNEEVTSQEFLTWKFGHNPNGVNLSIEVWRKSRLVGRLLLEKKFIKQSQNSVIEPCYLLNDLIVSPRENNPQVLMLLLSKLVMFFQNNLVFLNPNKVSEPIYRDYLKLKFVGKQSFLLVLNFERFHGKKNIDSDSHQKTSLASNLDQGNLRTPGISDFVATLPWCNYRYKGKSGREYRFCEMKNFISNNSATLVLRRFLFWKIPIHLVVDSLNLKHCEDFVPVKKNLPWLFVVPNLNCISLNEIGSLPRSIRVRIPEYLLPHSMNIYSNQFDGKLAFSLSDIDVF